MWVLQLKRGQNTYPENEPYWFDLEAERIRRKGANCFSPFVSLALATRFPTRAEATARKRELHLNENIVPIVIPINTIHY